MFGHSNRGARGYIVISGPDAPTLERETLQCVHCGKHWIYEPGSGRRRGWCAPCNGVTCGAERCAVCVPLEARIEIMEGAKTSQARRYLDDYKKSESM